MDFPKSVPGVGLVAGRFVDENPVAGTPGSLIPAAWGNAVTLELLAVIQAAGLTPAEADVDQLAEAIGKIIADGLHKTQPQFDNTKKFASTEFVQRALGSLAGQSSYNANTVIPAADAGKRITTTAAITLTLPLLSSVPVGSKIYVRTLGGANTVQRQGADTIATLSQIGLTSFTVPNQTMAVFTAGSGNWNIDEGDAALTQAPLFGYLLAGNGYQKLPSGLIIQWGNIPSTNNGVSSVTYPVAFPNAILATVATSVASAATIPAMNSSNTPGLSGTTFYLSNSSASGIGGKYIAIGY